jgi:hypothetical protein
MRKFILSIALAALAAVALCRSASAEQPDANNAYVNIYR